jgi:hypothetical protein
MPVSGPGSASKLTAYEPSSQNPISIARCCRLCARVELLDHPKLITQICSLERRTARSGKDSIDAQGHEDPANAVSGAVTGLILQDWSGGRAILEVARQQMEAERAARRTDKPKPIEREWAKGSVEWQQRGARLGHVWAQGRGASLQSGEDFPPCRSEAVGEGRQEPGTSKAPTGGNRLERPVLTFRHHRSCSSSCESVQGQIAAGSAVTHNDNQQKPLECGHDRR